MIIGKLDVARSTTELEKRGHVVTREIRAQLDTVVARLLDALPNERAPDQPHRFRGERQGDGIMIGAPREHALAILHEAMKLRDEPPWQHPTWLPLRMVFGIAEISWDGGAWAPRSVPNGRDITIISRLLETECPAGSIVVNEALLRTIHEYNTPIYQLFETRTAELKGIENAQTYGRIPARAHPRLTPVLTRWKLFVQSPGAHVVLTIGAVAWAFVGWWWLW